MKTPSKKALPQIDRTSFVAGYKHAIDVLNFEIFLLEEEQGEDVKSENWSLGMSKHMFSIRAAIARQCVRILCKERIKWKDSKGYKCIVNS